MYLAKIDLAFLGSRLSKSRHQPMSNGDVMDWLLARGFRMSRGGWLTSAAGLLLLELREIIFSRPLDPSTF